MKRFTVRSALLGSALLALLAGSAQADLTIEITVADSYGNVGGEFLITHSGMPFVPVGLVGSNPFESFCLEYNESLNFTSQYYAAVNDSTVLGGVGGGNPDPLDPMTAYLYEQFITGNLAGYAYDTLGGVDPRFQSADDLQNVIWYIEEERPISWTPGDGSRRDLFYQNAVANAGESIGNVRVLNLYSDAAGTIHAQDQIVLTPEPSSLVLLALGSAGLLRRRR